MMTQPVSQLSEPPPAPLPPRSAGRWSWFNILLVASLALNLFILGAIAADRFSTGVREQAFGPQLTQLMPRKFLRSLDGDRRREIIGLVRNHRLAIREGRERAEGESPGDCRCPRRRSLRSGRRSRRRSKISARTSNRMVDQGLGHRRRGAARSDAR